MLTVRQLLLEDYIEDLLKKNGIKGTPVNIGNRMQKYMTESNVKLPEWFKRVSGMLEQQHAAVTAFIRTCKFVRLPDDAIIVSQAQDGSMSWHPFTQGVLTQRGQVYYFWTKPFMEKITAEGRIGTLIHELHHIVFEHEKQSDFFKQDHDLANLAQDAIINTNIKDKMPSLLDGKLKVELPDGVWYVDDKRKPIAGFTKDHPDSDSWTSKKVYDYASKNKPPDDDDDPPTRGPLEPGDPIWVPDKKHPHAGKVTKVNKDGTIEYDEIPWSEAQKIAKGGDSEIDDALRRRLDDLAKKTGESEGYTKMGPGKSKKKSKKKTVKEVLESIYTH